MSNLFSIYKREMKAYFVSPIAYVVLVIFLVVTGFFFTSLVQMFALYSQQAQMRPGAPLDMNLTEALGNGFFGNMTAWILFLLPILSMRLFSEEKRQGTVELLFTYPIRDWETLLGKYFACVTVFAAMLAISVANIGLLANYGDLELGPIVSAYFGLMLMGAAFLAVGTFVSSVTENQIVAAVGSFGALLLLFVLHWLRHTVAPALGRFLEAISIIEPYRRGFSKGIIEVHNVTYYILFAVFFLFLTLKVLESKKWRG